ncbi:hypothetical protein J4E85_009834 [Alternaria conjuncta]|uniref:uncharacterized protein n=1 Tax=Alternaria conjuncta TaxID=181017 RepID=UPI00221F9D0D|nr:uncharacterized protein J4E85_009834 [Alternaria conjuncta]KAI4917742.1 hypothetical protein J4E85_009834 [Alternaria conjuncta]
MGLAPLLVDTYCTYKKGTGNFVQWLAETARATGTVNNVFKDGHHEAVQPTGGRLKGAARKEAKKAGLTQNATATCQIPAKSFLTLATAIAGDTHASVPRSVFTTLRAVIQGRKDCAVWYAMTSDREDIAAKANNASHSHFIKLLEDVFEILKAKQPRAEHQSPKTTKLDPVPSTNMYSLLQDEALSEIGEMPEVIESHVRPTKEKVTYKLETSDADVSFAIFCFFKDATHLRLAVRRTWREFAKGDIGLQAAALTMNAALTMIEKLSNEFEEANPRFKDAETQWMHLEITKFVHDSYSKDGEGTTFIDAGDENHDAFAYKEGKQMLRSDTVMCTHTTDLLLSIFFARKSQEECRLTNDEKRFLKCVSQLPCAGSGVIVLESCMVQKAASTMLIKQQLNSWIIFCLQIFWDMQRELGSRLHVGKALFDKTGQQLIKCYQNYLDTQGLEDIGITHKIFRDDIIKRKDYIQTLINDAGLQQTFTRNEQRTGQVFGNIRDFSLLKCDPALCGLFLAGIRHEYHRTAIDMASNQGIILVAAHLYNAVKQTGCLPRDLQWADMDWLIEQQGSDWMFVGKKPEGGVDFGKHVNLAMGLSAHKFTKDYNSRKPGKEVETKVGGARRFKYHARYSELGFNREPRRKKQTGGSKAQNDVLIMVESLVNDYQDPAYDNRKGLSSLEKLRVFKLAIEKDEPALAFDVMELFLRCLQVLQDIQKHAVVVAPHDYSELRFIRGIPMNAVVCEMLYDLSGKEKRVHQSIFPVAAAILRKKIEKEGDAVLQKAQVWQDETRIELVDDKNEDEPSFENPDEDTMAVEWRNKFGCIVFQDANGDCRMPYGPPV